VIPLPPAAAATARFPTQPTNYGSTPDFRDALSSGERRLYDGKFRLDASSDATYRPPAPDANNLTSPPTHRLIGNGSGFVDSEPEIECRPLGNLPVSRAHRKFGGGAPPVVPNFFGVSPSPPPLVPASPEIRDVPMTLGGGRNTDGSGLGDSRHAVPESSLPSSFAPLPNTMSSSTADMLDAVEDIASGRGRPLSPDRVRHQTPPAARSDSGSDTDSDTDNDIPIRAITFQEGEYESLGEVREDMRLFAIKINDLIGVNERLGGEVVVLASRCERQQRRINALEDQVDELRRGEIPSVVVVGDAVTGPPKPKSRSRSRKNVKFADPSNGPGGPCPAPVSPPPPPPSVVRAQTVSGPALVPVLPAPVVNPVPWNVVARKGRGKNGPSTNLHDSGRQDRPLSASPNAVPARARHITMRFSTRRSINLPEGVTCEGIRSRINQSLANQGKVRGTTPYVREARLRNEIGCIFLTLAGHAADEVWRMLDRCHAALMRDLGLPDFSFAPDIPKIKVLVSGVPLSDTGRGSIWSTDGWTGDRAYDGLRVDLEQANPGVVVAGRPNLIGSIYAMKQAGMVHCSVRFLVERNTAIEAAIKSGKIFLRGSKRPVRVWLEHQPATVCGKCLQIGHNQITCGFAPRCRFCRQNHLSREHHCPVLNCNGSIGEACSHTSRVCMLCERTDHFTGYEKCPNVVANAANGKLTTSSPPEAAASGAEADDTSRMGYNDRTMNRAAARSVGRRPTPLYEQAVAKAEKLTDKTAVSADKGKTILRRTMSDSNLNVTAGSSR